MNKVLKVGLILFGIVFFCFILYTIYVVGLIGFLTYSTFKTIDGNKVEYRLDEKSKLTDDNLKKKIVNKLSIKYNKKFIIENIKKEKIRICKTGLDSYRCYEILDDGYEYTFIIKDEDDVYFSVYYSDAYYSKKKSDKQETYIESKYNDNYEVMLQINSNEQFIQIKKLLSEYMNQENKKLINIYYLCDEYFEYRNYGEVELIVNLDEFSNHNIEKEITDNYYKILDNTIVTRYYILIGQKKLYLQRSSLQINFAKN